MCSRVEYVVVCVVCSVCVSVMSSEVVCVV